MKETHLVPIEEATQWECPQSLVGRFPQMDSLAAEVIIMKQVRDASGAVLFGPDTSKWPGRWFDAVRIAELEDTKVNAAVKEYGSLLVQN